MNKVKAQSLYQVFCWVFGVFLIAVLALVSILLRVAFFAFTAYSVLWVLAHFFPAVHHLLY